MNIEEFGFVKVYWQNANVLSNIGRVEIVWQSVSQPSLEVAEKFKDDLDKAIAFYKNKQKELGLQ